MNKRFFSSGSFWNTPIPENPAIDPESDHYINLLAGEPIPNFWLNIHEFTIPVYEVGDSTPMRYVHPMTGKFFEPGKSSHGTCFENPLPIPDHAIPDPKHDRHMALVDYKKRKAWDMFYVKKREDGEWESMTGMTYSLDEDGIFDPAEFAVKDGESIHKYGPGRAAGVPIIAGLFMLEEILAGVIEHKLVFATACNAYKKYVWPATWTDGFTEGGLPEGCLIQLDPSLDVDKLGLSPGAKVIARALQKYGAVNVDVAGGTTIYGEGLYGQPGKSWDGILKPDDLRGLDIRRFRVLKTGTILEGGRYHSEENRRELHDKLWGKKME
ncbi:MAG: hypothetical protein ACM3WV_11320 [Bacillota bacterium]